MTKLSNTPETRKAWKENMQATRTQLKALSEQVKPMVPDVHPTVNEAIIAMCYRDGKHREFKSYMQWKAEGYFVRPGEKGFPVWSRPVSKLKEEKQAEKGEPQTIFEEDDKTFRVAYLFSNAQVMKEQREGRAAA